MYKILKKHVIAGLLSLDVPGVPWHTQILADLLTLFQPGGGDRLCPPNYYWHTRYFRPSDSPVPLSLLTNVPSCVFLVLIFTLWKMTFHIKQIKRAYDNCRVCSIQTCQHKLRNYEMTTEIRINRFLWPIASICMYQLHKVGD